MVFHIIFIDVLYQNIGYIISICSPYNPIKISISLSLGLIVVNTILMFLILLILPESCTSIKNEMLSERYPIDLEKLKMLNRDHDATIFHEIGGVCSIENLLGSVSYCSTFHSAFFLTECSHLG